MWAKIYCFIFGHCWAPEICFCAKTGTAHTIMRDGPYCIDCGAVNPNFKECKKGA